MQPPLVLINASSRVTQAIKGNKSRRVPTRISKRKERLAEIPLPECSDPGV
jgi:hypothetical protein